MKKSKEFKIKKDKDNKMIKKINNKNNLNYYKKIKIQSK
jgi:hypothetical protein